MEERRHGRFSDPPFSRAAFAPSSVAIEIENGGDFATFLGEEYIFLSLVT